MRRGERGERDEMERTRGNAKSKERSMHDFLMNMTVENTISIICNKKKISIIYNKKKSKLFYHLLRRRPRDYNIISTKSPLLSKRLKNTREKSITVGRRDRDEIMRRRDPEEIGTRS